MGWKRSNSRNERKLFSTLATNGMDWFLFSIFMREQRLKDIFIFQHSCYGNVSFDGFYKIPFDFKTHALHTKKHQIIINDTYAIINTINDYGKVAIILAPGYVKYDNELRTFQQWHENLKGGLSEYSNKRIERGSWSRIRKTEFNLQQILFVEITKNTSKNFYIFQKNFRNSNDKPRNDKVLLNLDDVKNNTVHLINFHSY